MVRMFLNIFKRIEDFDKNNVKFDQVTEIRFNPETQSMEILTSENVETLAQFYIESRNEPRYSIPIFAIRDMKAKMELPILALKAAEEAPLDDESLYLSLINAVGKKLITSRTSNLVMEILVKEGYNTFSVPRRVMGDIKLSKFEEYVGFGPACKSQLKNLLHTWGMVPK